ncbi:MAG: hypothetical protein ACLUNO_08995 [Oscillospiraceae bacterium]
MTTTTRAHAPPDGMSVPAETERRTPLELFEALYSAAEPPAHER